MGWGATVVNINRIGRSEVLAVHADDASGILARSSGLNDQDTALCKESILCFRLVRFLPTVNRAKAMAVLLAKCWRIDAVYQELYTCVQYVLRSCRSATKTDGSGMIGRFARWKLTEIGFLKRAPCRYLISARLGLTL